MALCYKLHTTFNVKIFLATISKAVVLLSSIVGNVKNAIEYCNFRGRYLYIYRGEVVLIARGIFEERCYWSAYNLKLKLKQKMNCS